MPDGTVRFTYLLHRQDLTADQPEWAKDGRGRLRAVLDNYHYTFRRSDPVRLEIGSQVAEDWDNVQELVERAKRLNPFGDPPAVEIQTTPMEEQPKNGNSVPLNNRPVGFSDLFRSYREVLPTGTLPDYELDRATNVYDLNLIMAARTQHEGYVGSVFPEKFRRLLRYIEERRSEVGSILDVGCGAGAFYSVLLQFCEHAGIVPPRYEGIDYSRNQIMRAIENYPRGTFRLGDASCLPYEDDSFDVTTTRSVLPFIPVERQLQALGEILRIGRSSFGIEMVCRGSENYRPGPSELMNRFFGETVTPVYYPDLSAVEQIVASRDDIEMSKQYTLILYFPSQMKKVQVTKGKDYEQITWAMSKNRDEFQARGIPEDDWPTPTFNTASGEVQVFECYQVELNPKGWPAPFDAECTSLVFT